MLSDKADFVDQIKQSGLPFVAGRAPKAFQLRNDLTRFVLCEFLVLRSPSSYFSMLVFVQSLSGVRLFCDPMAYIVAHQAPLSMGFSRQEYWSGLPFRTPGYLPNPGNKPAFPESPALAGRFFTTAPPGSPSHCMTGQ